MITIYKRAGETPLEALNRLRALKPELKDEALSYAGRLDPMADGVLLVLVGEENKQREKYLNQNKEYEATMLLGVETDTYDILGKVIELVNIHETNISVEEIADCLKDFVGEIDQAYPPYSSQPVNGKPLFEWAREGKLNEIIIPTKKVSIESIRVRDMQKIHSQELLKIILDKIHLVNPEHDFRQKEISSIWQDVLSNLHQDFITAKITVKCSSGTYIRSLIHEAGKKLNTNAIALSITRTKIG